MKPPILKGVKLVGIKYRPQFAKLIAASVTQGDTCDLVREPFNPFDKAAVMVVKEDNLICYVERDAAAEVATWMDQGVSYHAEIKRNIGNFMIANLVPTDTRPQRTQATEKVPCFDTVYNEDMQ